MSFLIIAHAKRTKDFTLTIKSPSGGYVVLADTDIVRVKISRGNATVLDLDNNATDDGSVVTIAGRGADDTFATATLRLAQGDLTTLKGMYEMEITVVDASETDPDNAIKVVDIGSVEILASPSGDVGLT